MNRVRFLGFLVGALSFWALGVPASALAGTYTWNLATDFNASPGATNPDDDQYGGTPWSYVQATSGTAFSLLAPFASNFAGGLSTWGSASAGVVGKNPTPNALTDAAVNATVQPGQIFLAPGSGGKPVAVGWTSPFNQPEVVTVDGSVSVDSTCTTYSGTWKVTDQTGAPLPKATGTGAGTFTTSATVPPGGSIHFVVSGSPPTSSCAATGLSSLVIQATAVPPGVTLTSPAPGSSTTANPPTFSGAAGNNFGDGSQVTVRVYSGSSASGTPVRTVTVPRSGAGWSAALGSALPLGTYTAQAEQDSIVGDVGLSSPVTFDVRGPAISLNSLGSGPLRTSTPIIHGNADTAPGASQSVTVQIFAGTSAKGSPTLSLVTSVTGSGQFSVTVSRGLADGDYTAVALQGNAAGGTDSSAPQTFGIDTHAPPITLIHPGGGSQSSLLDLVFTGAASNHSFDSGSVTVTLYRGKKAAGRPIATVRGTVAGSTWSATWPGNLAPAVYTARASQTDAVGHVGRSKAHTFRIVPGVATINRAGRVSLKVACHEPAGDTCSGTIFVRTVGQFQTLPGGPPGRLTVMFAYVRIPGGKQMMITRTALSLVATVLRRQATVPVAISANLRPRNGKTIRFTAGGYLRRLGT